MTGLLLLLFQQPGGGACSGTAMVCFPKLLPPFQHVLGLGQWWQLLPARLCARLEFMGQVVHSLRIACPGLSSKIDSRGGSGSGSLTATFSVSFPSLELNHAAREFDAFQEVYPASLPSSPYTHTLDAWHGEHADHGSPCTVHTLLTILAGLSDPTPRSSYQKRNLQRKVCPK